MIFQKHLELEGRHAFLSPSQYHWTNYTEERLEERFQTCLATQRGTELHDFAANAIRLGVKLKGCGTLASYVNDAIGYRMTPEQPLYFSENCFGTCDAISFRRKFLRIHDLKTGKIPASMVQLEIYAALFCLEYGVKPGDIQMELRIYQNDEVVVFTPTAPDIAPLMDLIITFDKKIESMKGYE